MSFTNPTRPIGPFPKWNDPDGIVTLDPWGASITESYSQYLDQGYSIQPTIAITEAHLQIPEVQKAVEDGDLKVDGKVIVSPTNVRVSKAAIEPVWYIPGMAHRLGLEEGVLRKILFQETGGMFPELVTRPDLKVLLPPIGGTTAYIFGDPTQLADTKTPLTCRVHDECNGSDVFGSDICTCRPYLIHGIVEAVKTAQAGGNGLIVYFRKEGRALGEVTKYLVYNARKRQEGGDSATNYFYRTECVAGVQDARFQEFMPDVLCWLGITQIDRLISMSDMKYNAMTRAGIKIKERVDIPEHMIPEDAQVEIEAKKAAGYYTGGNIKEGDDLESVKGRSYEEE